MRQKRTAQASIYELFADHDLGRELQGMSEWLDAHPKVLTPVMNDLSAGFEAHRSTRTVGGVGAALRGAQAAPAIELRGAGLSPAGLGELSGLRPVAG